MKLRDKLKYLSNRALAAGIINICPADIVCVYFDFTGK